MMYAYGYPSLHQRIIHSRSTTPTPTLNPTPNSRGNYRKYEQICLEKAVIAVEQGKSLRQVSEMYGVPRSTLHDHYVGKHQMGSKSGPKPYLTIEEEEELVSFLDKSATIGYPYTRKHVLSLVQQILNSKGIDTIVSNGWWERFCIRHPSLTLRTAVPLSLARAMATDYTMLENYFDMLQETLEANGIFNQPSNIFNCDETGFPLSPKAPKVISKKGLKQPSHLTSDTKSQITVLVCANAAGYVIPPFVIFDRKTLNPQLTIGEVPGTLYGLSRKGWIDRSLFSDWFFNHFLPYAPSSRPLLLLLDGHSSHYCPEVIRAAAAQKIIIFALPPNTTHLTQPLDKGPFSPLKYSWKEACHNFIVKNPGRCVTRYDFCYLFSEAWYKSMTMKNIAAGFKTTGVCPFDRTIVQIPIQEDTTYMHFQPENVVKTSGLAYIPLYSPKPSKHYPVPDSPLSHQSSSVLEETFLETSDDSRSEDQFIMPFHNCTSISKFFVIPTPPSQLPTKHTKCPGKVLTSIESLQILEEREKKKEEEAWKKEERKRMKEENAKKKQEETFQKEERRRMREEKKEEEAMKKEERKRLREENAQKREYEKEKQRMKDKLCKEPVCNKEPQVNGNIVKSSIITRGRKDLKEPKPLVEEKGNTVKLPMVNDGRKDLKEPWYDKELQGKGNIVKSSIITRGRKELKEPGCDKEPQVKGNIVKSSIITRGRQDLKEPGCDKEPQVRGSIVKSSIVTRGRKDLKEPEPRVKGNILKSSVVTSGSKDLKEPGCDKEPQVKGNIVKSSIITRGRQDLKEPGCDKEPQVKGNIVKSSTIARGRQDLKEPGCDKEPQVRGSIVKSSIVTRGRKDLKEPEPRVKGNILKSSVVTSGRKDLKEPGCNKEPQVKGNIVKSSIVTRRRKELKEPVCDKQPQVKEKIVKFSTIADDCEVVVSKWWNEKLKLTTADSDILISGRELNSSIINAAQLLLAKQFQHLKGFQDTTLSTYLKFSPINKGVQILHTGSSHHWVCVSSTEEAGRIDLLDSLASSMTLGRDLILQIAAIFRDDSAILKIHKMGVQQQSGMLDCGLFSIAFAFEICEGRMPIQFDQGKMRKHLHKCLTYGVLKRFPSTHKQVPLSKSKVIEIKRYCFCNMPEMYDLNMISCDHCKKWFHFSCAGINRVIPESWTCSICQGRGLEIVSKPLEFTPPARGSKTV